MVRGITAFALLFAACGGSASQIEVKGEDRSVVEMAGDWKGSYVGVDSGRKGSISFSFMVGRHTAEGEVIMHPITDQSKPRPLEVRYVELAEGGSVHGKLSPYTDPQCNCSVVTEFVGMVEGNRIEGTFTTTAVTSKRTQTGRWWVERAE
ncbi:MAG: hypothetical protein MJE77_04795 [Proteobacteria bacterium]|nr:hypothetical protein [Pseudomonadota bacterium]